MSKVFEKQLYNRMINVFVKNDLFIEVQFSFRSDHSCVHSVSEITDYILDALDKKITSQTCFLISEKIMIDDYDTLKAYDTIMASEDLCFIQ